MDLDRLRIVSQRLPMRRGGMVGRTQGAINRDHAERRAELTARALRRLMAPDGATLSLRGLSESLGVSRPTLLHYFGSHEGIIQAALEAAEQQGQRYLQRVAAAELGPVSEALAALLGELCLGWRYGVGAIHRLGLLTGLSLPPLGETYINAILEPILQSFEARLSLHIQRQELRASLEPRLGALTLISPLLLALLHQQNLPGDRCRPLDMDTFRQLHLEAFLRAWAPLPSTSAQQEGP